MSQKEIQIPKGWELKMLQDICKSISSGGTPNRSNLEYFGGNIPWLKIGDLNNGVISDSNEKITEIGLENSSAKLFPKDTVLFAMYGATIGKTGILEKPCATNQAICGMICSDFLLPHFLLYFLQSKYYEIRKMAEGGAQPNINQNKLKILEIILPSLEIQKKIVQKLDQILGELEEKKKQIISLIEQNKERIDFFEKNWISYVIDNEIEKHPQRNEWKLGKIKDYVKDIEKRNPTKIPTSSFKYVEISSVNQDKKIESFKQVLGHDAPSRARNVIRTNDIIYGTTRPYYRNVVLIPEEFDNEICSTGFCVLRIKNSEMLPDYLFYYMLSNIANTLILKPMRGGNYPAVSNNDVIAISIPIPPFPIQKQIVKNIKNTEEKFKSQKIQFENIKQSYDSKIQYINHIQLSILNSAFTGKLVV